MKEEQMQQIYDEVLKLKTSPLYKYRIENKYLPVIGEGSLDAGIIFIGEAPGKNEALTGRPFCGASGKILDELLSGVGIKREDVYITSIVKDRPPENRDPKPAEIESYAPFLDRQIDIIKPKVIATLGRYSMIYIMNRYGLSAEIQPIGEAHGKAYKTTVNGDPVTVIALYHPSVALYRRSSLTTLKADFRILKKYL